MTIKIGTAGWALGRDVADCFPTDGTSLQRYAAELSVAEINSSFHRSHRISTWERWRDSVPDDFRFAAKLPKTITHQRKLVDCSDLLTIFLAEAHSLRDKLAVLLVQLPPKLEFDAATAGCFFQELTIRTPARIVCEPRNVTWFASDADALLVEHGIARVAADPAVCEAAARPGGWRGLTYWRLHGSPVIYRSSYANRIDSIADDLRQAKGDCWCIFDNTASSAAIGDALTLSSRIAGCES